MAQDILYQLLDAERGTNYWVFQGNPDRYDFYEAIKNNVVDIWSISAHHKKIKVGDKVILWITGKNAGCYALCEITREPFQYTEKDSEYWKDVDKSEWKAGLKITHNLIDTPITKELINTEPKLNELNVGHQGTNFSATKEEFDTILKMIQKPDDKWIQLKNIVEKFDNEVVLNKLFDAIKHIIQSLNIEYDDDIIYSSSLNNNIQFTIGSFYIVNLKKQKGELLMGFYIPFKYKEQLSKKYDLIIKKEDEEQKKSNNRKIWLYIKADLVDINDLLNPIIEQAKATHSKQEKSNYLTTWADKHNKWIPLAAIDLNLRKKLFGSQEINVNENIMKKSLNSILYGPPGTGKTYNTKNKALDIVNPDFNTSARKDIKEQYNKYVEKGQITFITFHQSMSYEEFVEGIKPKTVDNNVTYNIENGLFKRMVNRALYAFHNNNELNNLNEHLTFDAVYDQFLNYLNDKIEENKGEFVVPLKSKGYTLKVLSIEDEDIWTQGSSSKTEVKVAKEKNYDLFLINSNQ